MNRDFFASLFTRVLPEYKLLIELPLDLLMINMHTLNRLIKKKILLTGSV